MHLLIVILLVLAIVGAFPRWPYNAEWGYWPAGSLGVVLIVLLVLILMGHL